MCTIVHNPISKANCGKIHVMDKYNFNTFTLGRIVVQLSKLIQKNESNSFEHKANVYFTC